MFVPPEIVHLKCYFRINPVKPDIWNNGLIFLIFWNKTSSLCTVKHSVTFRTDNFPRPFIEMAQNSLTHVSDGRLVWSQQFVWHISAQIVLWTCRNIQVLWRECLHRHLKWIVQPKMKILSTFSYPQVVPNVVWLFWKLTVVGIHWCTEKYYGGQWRHQLFGYQHSSKYLLLCSIEERNSYKFGMI